MNRCIRCHNLQSEPAGEGCGNPPWHDAPEPKEWACPHDGPNICEECAPGREVEEL